MKQTKRKIILLLFIVNCSLQIAVAQPTQEWVARYERPSGSSGIANQMALDKVGNCYVLGNVPIQAGIGGILTIKYNSNGDTLWTRTYNIGNGTSYRNYGITADSIGNVYVTGYVGLNLLGPYDIVTIKYSFNGVTEWINTYSGAGDISDTPGDIKIGPDGMIYVAGRSGSSSIVIKYKPDGDSVWVKLFNEAGFSNGAGQIEFGEGNKIFVRGNRRNINNNLNYYMLLKYDTSGTILWNRNFTINGTETARDMAVDRIGNCFISGDGFSGYTTVKFDSSGSQQWVRTYFNNVSEEVRSICVDLVGNCYVTGKSALTSGNSDILTIKYATNGDSIWIRRFNGTDNLTDTPYDITIDDSSSIYLTGLSMSASSAYNFITLKYDSSGVLRWDIIYNSQPPGNGDDISYNIMADRNNNIYISGVADRGSNIFDYVTIKYSQPPIGVIVNSNSISTDFNLYQNYPNPFNPVTKFKFHIYQPKNVKLVIYDILGNVISTLVNKYLKAGTYEINYNAEKIASGIYFCKMIVNDYTMTKKMLLIK